MAQTSFRILTPFGTLYAKEKQLREETATLKGLHMFPIVT